MQKERTASALAHGLPVPTRQVTSGDQRTSSPPAAGSPSRTPAAASLSSGLPLSVKLVGLGLGILGLVYGLTLFRDHPAHNEAPVATSSSAAAPALPNLASSSNAASLNPASASPAAVK